MVSSLEIVVSPEDDAEIRRLSLTNNGLRTREIEITSYAEIVLAPFPADIAHPAFSNLFIQTEYLPQACGLIAQRRQRAANDPKIWAAHVLAGSQIGDGRPIRNRPGPLCRAWTNAAGTDCGDGWPPADQYGRRRSRSDIQSAHTGSALQRAQPNM